jgi:hypothetical protein
VEPNYEKKLETLEKLLVSQIVYGYHPVINFTQYTLSYPKFVKFVEQKILKKDCSDVRKFIERKMTKRCIATFVAAVLATYVARKIGTLSVGKLMCSLDQVARSGGLNVLFRKRNPISFRFNILMRCYLEDGLLKVFWTELQHRASLKCGDRYEEAVVDTFFSFSLSLLMP